MKSLLYCVLLFCACSTLKTPSVDVKKRLANFDWQGHRGCRGLWPENSLRAMEAALDFPLVSTLEMDLAVTKDNFLVLSHEPWMSHEICTDPKDAPISAVNEQSLRIYGMTLEEVAGYDCGSISHPRFPGQKTVLSAKPELADLISNADSYARMKRRALPYYNIEIKSQPEWDDQFTPPIAQFVALTRKVTETRNLNGRITIQSFDPRALNEYYTQCVKERIPPPKFALLVENLRGVASNLSDLTFKPDIYSCYYKLLTAKTVLHLQEMGIRVIPWTVNEVTDMQQLIEMGVDGIITDYPDRIELAIKKYETLN